MLNMTNNRMAIKKEPGEDLTNMKSGKSNYEEQPETGGQVVNKAGSYYMDNYEATITVHKSPPLQRRPFMGVDFMEIDDETRDEPVFTKHKLSKRKNLKVTFSDHIDIDVISLIDDDLNEFDDEDYGDETISDLHSDCSYISHSNSSTSDLDLRLSLENNCPKPVQFKPIPYASSGSPTARNNVTKFRNPTQSLLPKRKGIRPSQSLSDLEQKTKDHISKLHEKRRFASFSNSSGDSPRSILPDIPGRGIKTTEKYKQFISGVKRAVETTRSYEKPWLHISGRLGYEAVPRAADLKAASATSVRRTSSLPKNFKLPTSLTSSDQLPHRRSSTDSVRFANSMKTRIRNS